MALPKVGPDTNFFDLLKTHPTTNFSVGVFTHSSGDYYLIKIEGGVISAAKLVMTTSGTALQSSYQEDYPIASARLGGIGADEQLKWETYLLGQATSSEDFINIGVYAVDGAAIQYGWNFNWNGSEASIVTHERNNGVLGFIINWTARLYKIQISEVDDTLVAITYKDEESDWEPKMYSPHIWYAEDSGGLMDLWYWYSCDDTLPSGYGEGAFDVPVYTFYLADGSRQIIRYKQAADVTKTVNELEQEAREQLCSCYGWRFNQPGEYTSEYEGYTSAREKGFYTGAAEYFGVDSPGGYREEKRLEIIDINEVEGPYLGCGDVDLWNHRSDTDSFEHTTEDCTGASAGDCVFDYKAGNVDFTRLYSNSALLKAVTPLLVLPYHSTESVYIGLMDRTITSITTKNNVYYTPIAVRQWTQYVEPITGWVPLYFPVIENKDGVSSCDNTVVTCNSERVWQVQGCSSSWTKISDNNTFGVDLNEIIVSLSLLTPFETTEVDRLKVFDVEDLQTYQNWFIPSVCGTFVQLARVQNYQSAFGNSIRLESGIGSEMGSNNIIDPENAEPYGLWVGRS